MRCAAHILNLIVRDGLDIIKDGITLVRESVVYWNSTPKRVQIFYETAKQLRVVTEKKLVLDCPTRWNSTYAMLSHAKPYKEVFFRLKIKKIVRLLPIKNKRLTLRPKGKPICTVWGVPVRQRT